jgi:hypothetical protein
VFDNALVLPEYLVEFEYVTTNKSASEGRKMKDQQLLNQDLNGLLGAINSANKVLDNTYIQHAQRNKNKQQAKIHMATSDMDRSDMGCFKKSLLDFMRSCHIEELNLNGY